MKRFFHIIAILVLFSSLAHAFPLINDGSFEKHCTTDLCSFTPTGGIYSGPDWNVNKADNAPFLVFKDTNTNHRATDGNYYANLSVKGGSLQGMALIMKTLLNGGLVIYDVNAFIWNHTGTGAMIIYNYADGSGAQVLFHSTIKSQVEGTDKNFTIPNVPGYFEVVLSTNGPSGSDSNYIIDNIRHTPLPEILTDVAPYTTHLLGNTPFSIDLNFTPGYTCTVSDGNSTFATSDLGNGLYHSVPIAYNVTNLISASKNFSATCNGALNTDSNWGLKINEHNLISVNGGFDTDGNPNFTTSTSTGIADWNFITGGATPGRFQVFDNTSASGRVSTDGHKYLRLTSGATVSSEIRTKDSLHGGTVYYDVIDFNNGNPDANFTINYTYDSNGLTQTLYSSNNVSNVIGMDKSIAIPNDFGKLSFIVGSASTDRAFLLLDNVRYTNSVFLSNPECKSVINNGDPQHKINVVFAGSGFPDLTSFGNVVNDMIGLNGTYGLMHYHPFSDYNTSFNFWKVNTLQTFGGGVYSDSNGVFHDDNYYESESRKLISSVCNDLPQDTTYSLTLMVAPRVQSHSPWGRYNSGIGTKESWLTIGQEYLSDCDPVTGCSYPWPINLRMHFNLLDSEPFGYSKQDIQTTLVHEFGHSFGGLADEYDFRNLYDINHNIPNPGGPSGNTVNCDDNISGNACADWNNFSGISCSRVCGYSDWFRPIDNSIMGYEQRFGAEYGPVNQTVLVHDINVAINQHQSLLAPQNFSYFFDLNYDSGNIRLNGVTLDDVVVSQSQFQYPTDYHLSLFTADNSLLYDYNFNFPLSSIYAPPMSWFDENGNQIDGPGQTPISTENDLNYFIRIPYFSDAKVAKIFDTNNTLKLTIDLSTFNTKIQYTIGFGSGILQDQNYHVSYSMISQPISSGITSSNYVCKLGPTYFIN